MGEHLPCKQGVDSSNLFISTRWRFSTTGCAGARRGERIPETGTGGRGKDRGGRRGQEGRKASGKTPGGRNDMGS